MSIQVIVFLLFVQSFTANSPAREEALPPAAGIVFQSADGGRTWQDVSAGLPEDLQPAGVFADGGEVFLFSERGLYRSRTVFPAPIWEKELLLNMNIADIFAGQAGRYAFSPENGLFLELPGTGIWTPVEKAPEGKTACAVVETPFKDVYDTECAGDDLFCSRDAGIFRSSDRGETWELVRSSTEGRRFVLAVSGPTIYAVMVMNTGGC